MQVLGLTVNSCITELMHGLWSTANNMHCATSPMKVLHPALGGPDSPILKVMVFGPTSLHTCRIRLSRDQGF